MTRNFAACRRGEEEAFVAAALGQGKGRMCLDIPHGTGLSVESKRATGYLPVELDISSDHLRLARHRPGFPVRADVVQRPMADGMACAAIGMFWHTDVGLSMSDSNRCFVGSFVDRTRVHEERSPLLRKATESPSGHSAVPTAVSLKWRRGRADCGLEWVGTTNPLPNSSPHSLRPDCVFRSAGVTQITRHCRKERWPFRVGAWHGAGSAPLASRSDCRSWGYSSNRNRPWKSSGSWMQRQRQLRRRVTSSRNPASEAIRCFDRNCFDR